MAVEAITLSSIASTASKADGIGASAKGIGNAQLSAKFTDAMNRLALSNPSANQITGPMKGMFNTLDQINVEARSVSDYAATAEASGGQLTPGEIVQLTMKCQEFMFQCQLTSNIANRSSDGVQQLFRQQG
jgi:hypothetical protein